MAFFIFNEKLCLISQSYKILQIPLVRSFYSLFNNPPTSLTFPKRVYFRNFFFCYFQPFFHKHLIDNLSHGMINLIFTNNFFLSSHEKQVSPQQTLIIFYFSFGFLSKRFFNMSYSIFILCKFNSKYCE